MLQFNWLMSSIESTLSPSVVMAVAIFNRNVLKSVSDTAAAGAPPGS